MSGIEADTLWTFLNMGGHGLYIWLSYGAALAVVLYNAVSVRRRERRFFRDERERARRHQAGAVDPAHRGTP